MTYLPFAGLLAGVREVVCVEAPGWGTWPVVFAKTLYFKRPDVDW